MTTAADRVAAHNARRHNHNADPLCSLCPDYLPIDDVKQRERYVPIHDRLVNLRDAHYFFVSQYDDEVSAFQAEPDSYLLLCEGLIGGTEIGTAYTEDAAIRALQFMRRA